MAAATESALTTAAVARQWFSAMGEGRVADALNLLDENVTWINYSPVDGYNTDMPWIGTYHGRDAVAGTFQVFGDLVQVNQERLVSLAVDGDQAAGVIAEHSTVKATGQDFRIEFVQWLTIRNGKIVRWKSYTDPSEIIRALRGAVGGAA